MDTFQEGSASAQPNPPKIPKKIQKSDVCMKVFDTVVDKSS